ncbi:hypothetical protein TYRP_000751 [Tyrophagus putrescentiae]|nr:hypothetical protein TYRP_000751 [Tyrophagus putrescentiae]
MSLSKHQRDLPQLCSLAIFSQMSLLDRISAHQVCPEWYHRVREVNQTTVRSLTITVENDYLHDYEFQINDSENGLRSARLLTNSDGSPQFPMHRLTKWNCLQFSENDQLNLVTLKQIVSAVPSITELIFVTAFYEKFDLLTVMLQNDHWRGEMISLKVINKFYGIYPTIPIPLFTAINSLSALKYLTVKGVKLYDMPILAQLKEISCDYEDTLLNSLQQHAVKKTGELSVEASVAGRHDSCITELSKLSDQLRSSISGLRFLLHNIENFSSIGTSFPNLTTLSLWVSSSKLGQLFLALSPLHRLQQLSLVINFTDLDPERQLPPPRAQLRSVKALDLYLYFNSHSQVHWLNLPLMLLSEKAFEILCKFFTAAPVFLRIDFLTIMTENTILYLEN